MPKRPHQFGLTIVEIVVVMSVIALLIGLLVPALSSVRTSSRAALCKSNMRHMVNATLMYANIHHHHPPALEFRVIGGQIARVEWDWITTLGGELIGPGPLWAYADSPDEVMQCPEFFGNSNAPGTPYTGYNYSPYLGGEQEMVGAMRFFQGARPHAVRRPSSCAMFGLGGYGNGANKFMRAPQHNELSDLFLSSTTVYAGGQAYDRYNGQTFVAFVDGHVRSHGRPEPGADATDALLHQYLAYPRNGFLSNTNEAYRPN